MRHSRVVRLSWAGLLLILLSAATSLGADPGRSSTGDSDPHREAQRYVEAALDASVQGDWASRETLLAEALKIAPDYAPARWQSGYVRDGDKWLKVEEAQKQAAADPNLREYRRLREYAGDSIPAHVELARWCRRQGLKERERFHWARVLMKNPRHEEAQRGFGVCWYEGELLTQEQIDQRREQEKIQKKIRRHYRPLIKNWVRQVEKGSPEEKSAALSEIRRLTEVEAIPLLEAKLSAKDAQISLALVEAIAQMDDPRATLSLARHAVFSPFEAVRYAATESLSGRPMHEFFPVLLGELKPPIESDYQISKLGDGDVKYQHEIVIEDTEAKHVVNQVGILNQTDLRSSPRSILLLNRANGQVREASGPRYTPRNFAINRAKVQTAAAHYDLFSNHASSIENRIDWENGIRNELNRRIVKVLTKVSQQDLGDDVKSWWSWWEDYNELYVTEKPVYETTETYTSTETYGPPVIAYGTSPRSAMSCFPAGTLVWTQTGKRPIETIKPGEWVLSQDVESGELTYKPILETTVRPPSELVVIQTDRQSVSATRGHPFWVNGKGWRMAKKLKVGDVLDTVSGPAWVEDLGVQEETEAHNLVVGGYGTYFVGSSGLLVHDNTLRQPTRAITPGLVVRK